MSEKAVIFLSTYNGEKYISPLLDSLLAQTYENLSIVIRDDGSTDATRSILSSYHARSSKIVLITDEDTLGYPECFYRLTDGPWDGSYFFFCDQDDVWLPDKVARAVSVMKARENGKPMAYYAGYRICGSDLTPIRDFYPRSEVLLRHTLYEVPGLEFAMTINREALACLRTHKPQRVKARGTWMCILFAAKGQIVTDPWISALYRRHENTVTLSKPNPFSQTAWRIKKFLIDGGLREYRKMLEEAHQRLKGEILPEEEKLLRIFSASSYFPAFIKKMFYPHRLRRNIGDEILLRLLFLLGRA